VRLLTKLTAQKNAVIDKLQGAVPAPRAISAINEQIARLSGINADAYAPVIAKLQNFRDQIASGKTLSQIEGNRKLLGDMFSDPSLASIKTDGEKAVNAIYAPLRDDMGAFIKLMAIRAISADGRGKRRTCRTGRDAQEYRPEAGAFDG
jgi:hypothetical protein